MSENDTANTQRDRIPVSRRNILAATGAVVPGAIAGCLGGEETGPSESDSSGGSSETESGSAEPVMGGTLRWGGSVSVQGLDPHSVTAAASWRVLESITQGLTTVNYDLEVAPQLASDWTVSDDGQSITFDIREGVQFHDGSELTSADILASFERIASGGYSASGYFEFVDSMSAPDDYTFEMTLSEPFSPLLARMSTTSMKILPEEQAQQNQISEPIGTGPFQFESREVGSEFVMTKNENYWEEGLPRLDRIEKREITEDDVRYDVFTSGEVDFINDIPPRRIDEVADNPEYQWEEKFPKILFYLGLNCDREPFDDPNVRLALDHAIDRDEIVEAALYGYGEPAKSPAYPGSLWEPDDIEVRSQDLERAQELMDQSSYSDEAEAVFRIPNAYSTAQPAAQVISQSAQEVGINLDIQQVTWSTWLSEVSGNSDFQATISTYMGLWYPDYGFYKFEHPEGAFHFTNWENEEYMQLVEEARTTFDQEERVQNYHEAARVRRNARSGHLLLYWKGYELASIPEYKERTAGPDGATLRFENNWMDQ
jgi:peptide/nickel transport system substrate-binding protein